MGFSSDQFSSLSENGNSNWKKSIRFDKLIMEIINRKVTMILHTGKKSFYIVISMLVKNFWSNVIIECRIHWNIIIKMFETVKLLQEERLKNNWILFDFNVSISIV